MGRVWLVAVGVLPLLGACEKAPEIGSPVVGLSVVISSPADGSSFLQGELISFEAMFQSTKYTPDLLSHSWRVAEVPMCEAAEVSEDGRGICEWVFDAVGEHLVTVEVTDQEPISVSDSVTLIIIDDTGQ